ncbi:MAG: DUF6599 family protein [Candidatus Coatesbacteria bacterium]
MPRVTRTISRREALTSWGVIAVLGVVAAGVLWKQSRFDPPDPGLGGDVTAPRSGGNGLFASLPGGLEPMSAPERFSPATLSDKIDGRAELYLSAGFAGLRAQRIRAAADHETWYEVFVYDMHTARNAFSVFSTQRREGVKGLPFATQGYRTGNSLCFVNGANYVEIVASRTGEKAMAGAESLGRLLAGAPGTGGGDLGEAGLFPAEGLIPASVSLTTANAFSFSRFDNVFSARYRDGGETLTLFLSRRASPREAAGLSDAYREFLVELDAKEAEAPAGMWLVELDGSFEGGFSTGRLLGGVHQAASLAVAARRLARLRAAVEGKAP